MISQSFRAYETIMHRHKTKCEPLQALVVADPENPGGWGGVGGGWGRGGGHNVMEGKKGNVLFNDWQ